MPYFAIAPSSDNRKAKQAATPLRLRNVYFEMTPQGASKRARVFLTRRPGRTRRAELQANVRGIFSAKGCQGGKLYAPAGSYFNEVSDGYGYASVGTIAGGDFVTMRADRADVGALAFGKIHRWNGTAFGTVTDADAPANAQTLAIVARRWLAAFEDNDLFGWSISGDYTDWPPNNQAADFDLPDPIVAQENVGGDLVSYNANSIQFWQPTGGAEEEAFAPVTGASIRETGLFGRHAVADIGDGQMFLGSHRSVYELRDYSVGQIPWRDLETALKDISDGDLALATAWSFRDGSHEFWGLNAGLERCFVYQRDMRAKLEWTRYGQSVCDIDFVVNAFGDVVTASKSAAYLWSFDDSVFTDDGDPIECIMSVHIPASGDVPVDRIVFDIATHSVPLSGDGAQPTMQARTSNDGGDSWSSWEDLELPTSANRFKPMIWGLGLADAIEGLLVEIRITEPFGFALYGLWCNPTAQEITTA